MNFNIIDETIAEFEAYNDDGNSIASESNGFSDDCSVASLNQYTLKNFQKNTPVFLRMVREENLEAGYSNSLDDMVNVLIDKDPIIAAFWLNDIYVNYYSDIKVLNAVLFTISRIENQSIRNSLITMAIAGLFHNDLEIRETSIRCFENWGDIASLKCLKTSQKDSVEWLNDYKKQVIRDIEKTLNSPY